MGRLTEIADGVLAGTSERYLTTTTVVTGPGGGCLVIDPAITRPDLELLAAELAARGLRPRAGWATHPHWDHVLWSRELGDAPRFATARCAQTAQAGRDVLAGQAERSAPGHDLGLLGRLTALPPGADAVPWDGPPVLVIEHDGHAPGHGALFLPDTGTLIAGDMCSDVEIPLLDLDQQDPMGNYRTGLARLAAVSGVRHVIPGHGHVGNAAEFRSRITADHRYVDALERGEPFQDSRMTQDWLRAEYDKQVRWAAAGE